MNITEPPHPAHDPQIGGENEGGHEGHSSPSSPNDEEGDGFKKGTEEKLKTGRRKINIEFIEDKSRRHITFSKRKAGIMKKAYELSTLTGTQVLLLVASETGHVYTFATPKLQPLITKPEGKNLIQSCLNAPEVTPVAPAHHPPRIQGGYPSEPPMIGYPTGGGGDMRENPSIEGMPYDEEKKARELPSQQESKGAYPMGMGGGDMGNYPPTSANFPPPNLMPSYMSNVPSMPRNYMAGQYAQAQHSQYPQTSQVSSQYGQQPYGGASYPPSMHGLSGWPNKPGGIPSMPLGNMQGQASQGQGGSAISGLIANKQGGEHSADHNST